MTTTALLLRRTGPYPAYVPPAVTTVAAVSSPSAEEGLSLVYTVTLSATTVATILLPYTLAGGTASAPDFGSPSFSNGVTISGANLSVPSGVLAFTVTVPALTDANAESAETLILTVGGVSGTGTILDAATGNIPATAVAARTTAALPADWIQTAHDGISGGGRSQLPPLIPYHGNSVGFKRPWFHWPSPAEANSAADDSTVYTLRVYADGGTTPLFSVTSDPGYTYARATADLTLGAVYQWDVLHPVQGASGKRTFRVLSDAVDYAPPTRTSAATVAAAKARPRFGLSAAKIAAYTSGSNTASFTRLKVLFDGNGSGGGFQGGALPADTPSTYVSLQEHARIICCQHLWQITGTAKYKTEGLRRLRNLISWSTGTVGTYGNADIFRLHVLTCAIGYDTWGADLTVPECTQYFDLLGTQLNALIEGVGSSPFFTTTNPWYSKFGRRMWHLCLFAGHDQNFMLAACAASIAVVGDEARFTGSHSNLAANIQTFCQAAEVILANFEFKATDDGAYRGGAAYLYTQHLFAVGSDALAACFGVDFWAVPRRARQNTLNPLLHPYYAGYVHDFGDDGAGRITLSRAYLAYRKKTAEMGALIAAGGWAVDDGDYSLHAHFYRDEAADPTPAMPSKLTAWSIDAGLFATHSQWAQGRFSIKLRADPQGSWNHSNLRNFSFMQWDGDVPIFFDGGRYDYFNSPHQKNFKGLAQKAGNVISMASRAGGQRGVQASNDSRSTQAGFQWVGSDDATHQWAGLTVEGAKSYQMTGYEHSKAKRSLLHIKPSLYITVDDHALSGAARTWEWNFHSENRQTFAGATVASNAITGSGTHNLPVGVGVRALISTPRSKPTSVVVAANVATWTAAGGHGLPLGSAVPVLITPISGYWPASGASGYVTANVSSTTVCTFPTTGIADGPITITSGSEPGIELVLDVSASVPNSSSFTATATGATLSNQTLAGNIYAMFGPSSSAAGAVVTVGNGAKATTITPLSGAGLSSVTAQLLTDSTWAGADNTQLYKGMANANSHPLGSQHFQSTTQQQHHNYLQYASSTTLLAVNVMQAQGGAQATALAASATSGVVTVTFNLSGYSYTATVDRATGECTVSRVVAGAPPAFVFNLPSNSGYLAAIQ